MEDFILNYQDGVQTVLSDGIFFKTEQKPELSFTFDALFCESPTNVYFYMAGENQILLSEEQIEEIQNYCYAYSITGDYSVFAYDPNDNNMYKGNILKSEAISKGYKWTITEVPENLTCSFDEANNKWITYYAAILDDGRLLENIAVLNCNHCVIFLTKTQFDLLPKKTKETDTWDFVNEKWVDKRDLSQVKYVAVLEMRNQFEAVRWKMNGEFVPVFEQDTWRIQLDEALSWKKDNSVETVYIDTYLSNMKLSNTSKEELVDKIIQKNTKYVIAMAKTNAVQHDFKTRIEQATTGYEVDYIVSEIQEYCNTVIKNAEL